MEIVNLLSCLQRTFLFPAIPLAFRKWRKKGNSRAKAISHMEVGKKDIGRKKKMDGRKVFLHTKQP